MWRHDIDIKLKKIFQFLFQMISFHRVPNKEQDATHKPKCWGFSQRNKLSGAIQTRSNFYNSHNDAAFSSTKRWDEKFETKSSLQQQDAIFSSTFKKDRKKVYDAATRNVFFSTAFISLVEFFIEYSDASTLEHWTC